MTFRTLLAMMSKFAADHPDHEALDEPAIVRVQDREDEGGDLHVGGLQRATVDAGCTETFALTLDASRQSDEAFETFRALLAMMSKFAADHPDHEALDEPAIARVQDREDEDGDLHVGGLRRVTVGAMCTGTLVLTLDADRDPDEASGEASDGGPH